jgi:mRNA guanylyltransferase
MPSTAPPQIPGNLIPHHEAEGLRYDVAQLLGRENTRFPGAQPVSFAKKHLSELQHQEYFMCEKTDGVRCLLYLTYIDTGNGFEPSTILIDRKNNYYDVQPPLRFPYYNAMDQPEAFLYGTLLDGELVHDRVTGQQQPRLIYYVFDCMAIDGVNYTGTCNYHVTL